MLVKLPIDRLAGGVVVITASIASPCSIMSIHTDSLEFESLEEEFNSKQHIVCPISDRDKKFLQRHPQDILPSLASWVLKTVFPFLCSFICRP